MCKRRCREGFTLIELLVVIAIMSVLLAVAVPTMNTARETAKRINCMAHLRELTAGWLMYAANNQNKLVSAYTSLSAYPASWVDSGASISTLTNGKLWPYVEDTTVYKCPNDTVNYVRTYSISAYLNGESSQVSTLHSIPDAARTLVFIEEYDQRGYNENSFEVSQYPSYEWIDIPAQWHRMAGMISFADGHAEPWNWGDQRTVDLETSYDEIQPGNNDLTYLQSIMGFGPTPLGY